MPRLLPAARSSLGDWTFWLWAVVGVGYGFAISVVGLVTVPAALLVTIVLLTKPRFRRSAFGLLVGIGAPLLWVAYDNREGPGTACHTFDGGRGTQCDELYDPRKWLVVGLVFVVAGLAAQVLTHRDGLPPSSRRA
ncbi:MAG TPA: hypothetical protein VH420_08765 [Gaiellaceae bacterium]|jgi:hypothetical protein